MKLRNFTHWRSNHLRAFVTRVAQEELDPKDRRLLSVVVTYNRGGIRYTACSGRAYRLDHHIKLMVPSGAVDRIDLAHVIAHEMAHLRGIKHRQMIGSARYRRVGRWREIYAWAGQLSLEKAQKTAPSREQRKEVKYRHTTKMTQTWQRRVRIAQGRLKTWQRRLRRLEAWRSSTLLAQAAEQPIRQETDHGA